MTGTARDLLSRASKLRPWERALLFDELYESLAGHDELDRLTELLENRRLLTWEPDISEIERRVTDAAERPDSGDGKTADEVITEVRRKLDERCAERGDRHELRREPRLAGAAGDLAGEALALPPAERAGLAYEILETIEPASRPSGPDDQLV